MNNNNKKRIQNGAPSRSVPPENRRNNANRSAAGNNQPPRRPANNPNPPSKNGRPPQRRRPMTEEEMRRQRSTMPANNGRPQNRRPMPSSAGAPHYSNNRRPANRPDEKRRNQATNAAKNQRPANNGNRTDRNPPRRSDWVYPEGYTPPANARRPQQQPTRRPSPQRKVPPKKKEPIIKINWARLFIVLGAFFLRFAICFALVAAIMFIIYRSIFFDTPKPVAEEVTYSLCNYDKDGEKYTAATFIGTGNYSYNRETLLISFSEISAWLDCAQVGDIYSMRYIITNEDGTSENVVFHNNSHNAFVNGTPVVMDCEANFDWGEVWVPLSFVSDYLYGVDISATAESVILTRNGDTLSFALRPTAPVANATIAEEE